MLVSDTARYLASWSYRASWLCTSLWPDKGAPEKGIPDTCIPLKTRRCRLRLPNPLLQLLRPRMSVHIYVMCNVGAGRKILGRILNVTARQTLRSAAVVVFSTLIFALLALGYLPSWR